VSGSEVIDFAIKLSRALTGRKRVIAMEGGYLGSTGFAASASGDPRFRLPFEPLIPNFSHVAYGDEDVLESEMDDEVACVVLESVQTWSGVRTTPDGYFERVRELCTAHGALMIIDENETAFGRCGSTFALEKFAPGVVPDIMTLGKAMSGGLYPIAAAIYRPEYLKFWEEFPYSHLSTFAGCDLACVIGLATIDWIERHRLNTQANLRGDQLEKGMRGFAKKYPQVLKGFRSVGLLAAVDFTSDELGPQMSRDLSQFGVLASCSPEQPATMFIVPPLIVTREDVESILEAFGQALAGVHSILVPPQIDSLQSLIWS
jgi:putrescine aminotransferase